MRFFRAAGFWTGCLLIGLGCTGNTTPTSVSNEKPEDRPEYQQYMNAGRQGPGGAGGAHGGAPAHGGGGPAGGHGGR